MKYKKRRIVQVPRDYNDENFSKRLKYKEDAIDNTSVTSSCGSCSINSYNYKPYETSFGSGGVEDNDAESVCEMGNDEEESDESLSLGDEIHRLELQAYRCTMEALHASGPLTWEKETMGQNNVTCAELVLLYM